MSTRGLEQGAWSPCRDCTTHRVVHLELVTLPGLDRTVFCSDSLLYADLQLLLRVRGRRRGQHGRRDDSQAQEGGLRAHFRVVNPIRTGILRAW